MALTHALEIRQAFTRYNNHKENVDTEQFMRTLKEEFVWAKEWTSLTAFMGELDQWIEQYNAAYLHSPLDYTPPTAFEQKF